MSRRHAITFDSTAAASASTRAWDEASAQAADDTSSDHAKITNRFNFLSLFV
jgi:hypothetical protein